MVREKGAGKERLLIATKRQVASSCAACGGM